MQAELREDSKTFAARLREAPSVCEEYEDIATGSVIQVSISNLRSHAEACLFLKCIPDLWTPLSLPSDSCAAGLLQSVL